MPEKDPTTWTLATWMLGFAMAMFGGAINWLTRLRRGHTKIFNVVELAGEVLTSGFVGMLVFMALDSMGQPVGLCAAAAGVGGHMATRLLYSIERLIESRIEWMNKK